MDEAYTNGHSIDFYNATVARPQWLKETDDCMSSMYLYIPMKKFKEANSHLTFLGNSYEFAYIELVPAASTPSGMVFYHRRLEENFWAHIYCNHHTMISCSRALLTNTMHNETSLFGDFHIKSYHSPTTMKTEAPFIKSFKGHLVLAPEPNMVIADIHNPTVVINWMMCELKMSDLFIKLLEEPNDISNPSDAKSAAATTGSGRNTQYGVFFKMKSLRSSFASKKLGDKD